MHQIDSQQNEGGMARGEGAEKARGRHDAMAGRKTGVLMNGNGEAISWQCTLN